MINKTQAEQAINTYLADETLLYQDWYAAFYPPKGDTDTAKFGSPSSLAKMKKQFKQWLVEQREVLQHQICDKWEYSKQRGKFKDRQAMIIAISVDCLAIALALPTTNVITVGTILVVEGYLDELCPDSSSELPKE